MNTDLIIDLIKGLTEITKNNILKWETTALPNQYISLVGEGAVCLSSDEGNSISMSIVKNDGEVAIKLIIKPTDKDYDKFLQLFQLIQLQNDSNQETLKQMIDIINKKTKNIAYSEIESS